MKKIIFCLILCANGVFAQQKTVIKDSILLNVLDTFIDELKLKERHNKIIRVGLISYKKELKLQSMDTASVGAVKGLRVDSKYETIYSFTVAYETNSKTIEWNPVTYYSFYREIPILITTGFEDLMQIDQGNKRKLMREIKKSSNPHSFGYPIIWGVEVKNRKASIVKSP